MYIKNMEEDINKLKAILCSMIRRISFVKMDIQPKLSANSVQSLSKFQSHFFTAIGKQTNKQKTIFKFVWKYKGAQITNVILKKKNEPGGITQPDFKLYYYAIIIKIIWCCLKNWNIDQWKRIKSPDIIPCVYIQQIFDKVPRTIF